MTITDNLFFSKFIPNKQMYRNKHPPSVILATYLRNSFLLFFDAVFGHFLLACFPAPEHYDIIDEFTEFSFPWNLFFSFYLPKLFNAGNQSVSHSSDSFIDDCAIEKWIFLMLERYDLYIAGFYYLLNNTVIEYITIQWESICKYYKKIYLHWQ